MMAAATNALSTRAMERQLYSYEVDVLNTAGVSLTELSLFLSKVCNIA